MYKILSKGIDQTVPDIDLFLEEEANSSVLSIVGWGHKETSIKAQKLAENLRKPYVAVEDGFIRSIGLGVEGAKPFSLHVDHLGIYYDATQASEAEYLIDNFNQWATPAIITRAKHLIKDIKEKDISKYNNGIKFTGKRNHKGIIVDQTYGDASITLGCATENSFQEMIDYALSIYDEKDLVIKTHPDVISGKKKGAIKNYPNNVKIITDNYTPLSLLQGFESIFVVTSQMGFDGLLLDKKVHVFGCPFYAGWGLTIDHGYIPKNRRRRKPPLEVLVAVMYILLSRYVLPTTKKRTSVENIIRYIANERNSN